MLPAFAVNHEPRMAHLNAVFVGNLAHAQTAPKFSTHLLHDGLCEFRCVVFFPLRHATFQLLVQVVVDLGAEE